MLNSRLKTKYDRTCYLVNMKNEDLRKNSARHPRADGERSRQTILKAASELATIEGLSGLSIARLADHVGMSKSGLFAHFKSKEDLQIATIDTAATIVEREILEPAMAAPPGLSRIHAFCEAYLSHLERQVFPGGCFFISVAAEFDAKPGPIRDYAASGYLRILAKFNDIIREAQQMGEIDAAEDVAQLAFELDSFMLCVNFAFVFFRDPNGFARGREAIRQRLNRAMPKKRVATRPSKRPRRVAAR